VCDTYRRKLSDADSSVVKWPSDFPADLISSLEDANLEREYSATVERTLGTPEIKYIRKSVTKRNIVNILESFIRRTREDDPYKAIARSYLEGTGHLKIVSSQDSAGHRKIANVVYLSDASEQQNGGIQIFIDEPRLSSIVTLPPEGTSRRRFIEGNKNFSRMIFSRIPIYRDKIPKNSELAYYRHPVGGLACPLRFDKAEDVLGQLHDIHIRLIQGDMDLLVSTDTERHEEYLMSVHAKICSVMAAVSLLVAPFFPVGFAISAFMACAGAGLVHAIRSIEADDPEDAHRLMSLATEKIYEAIITPIVDAVTEGFDQLSNDELYVQVSRG
jgi:hypothetical protein